jgi:hypothetical protein
LPKNNYPDYLWWWWRKRMRRRRRRRRRRRGSSSSKADYPGSDVLRGGGSRLRGVTALLIC